VKRFLRLEFSPRIFQKGRLEKRFAEISVIFVVISCEFIASVVVIIIVHVRSVIELAFPVKTVVKIVIVKTIVVTEIIIVVESIVIVEVMFVELIVIEVIVGRSDLR